MSWTSVNKPSTLAWTQLNTPGRQTYDDISVSYDDSGVYYDSVNNSMWTGIAKPTQAGLMWSELEGTWAENTQTWASGGVSPWTNVVKPT